MTAAKVAVSIPASLFEAVEEKRRSSGQTRSQFVQRALETLLERLEVQEAERQYVEGYNRQPETDGEVAAVHEAGLAALRAQPWE